MCQTSRDTHRILLGNTTLHKLLRQCVGIVAQSHRATSVSGYSNNIFIFTCQFQQRVSKLFSTCNHTLICFYRRLRRLYRFFCLGTVYIICEICVICGYYYSILLIRSSISLTASLHCSSFSTPWCHLAMPSMKLTPLPFVVLEINRCGFLFV